MQKATIAGALLVAAGAGAIAAGTFIKMYVAFRLALDLLGATLIVVATMIALFAWAARHFTNLNMPRDDAYEIGRGVGYSLGWRDCARKHIGKVPSLEDRRRSG